MLSLHSRKVRLPDFLADYLLESLGKGRRFSRRGRLPRFSPAGKSFCGSCKTNGSSSLPLWTNRRKQSRVPFSHEDVRAYIDTLFLDGSLTPVEREDVANLPAWVQTGVFHDPKADAVRGFGVSGASLRRNSPAPKCRTGNGSRQPSGGPNWSSCGGNGTRPGRRRAHGLGAVAGNGRGCLRPVDDATVTVRCTTCRITSSRSWSIRFPAFMAVERTRKKLSKIALLVLDGLAFDQWLLLKKNLEAGDKAWRFQESTAFAWVPTLTSVTRQSIFAGEPPLYFPDSLATTSKEKAHWLRFWEDQGVQRPSVDLVTSLDGPDDPKLEMALANPGCRSWGSCGTRSMTLCTECRCRPQGCTIKFVCGLLKDICNNYSCRLQQEGFAVYLTADHGNVTATGIGNPREGVLVETKGKRVRVYDRPEFLEEVATKFPGSLRWPNYGLPPERHVLLAGDLKAFTDRGDEVVSHGGIALEEVMVPFVAITREGT